MTKDNINIIIGEDARRQLEFLKEELELRTDGELINESLRIVYLMVKKIKKGEEKIVERIK